MSNSLSSSRLTMSNIQNSRQEIITSAASYGIRNKKGKDVIYSCIESDRNKLYAVSTNVLTNVIQTNTWIPEISFWTYFPAIFATIFRLTMVSIIRWLIFSIFQFPANTPKSIRLHSIQSRNKTTEVITDLLDNVKLSQSTRFRTLSNALSQIECLNVFVSVDSTMHQTVAIDKFPPIGKGTLCILAG